MRKIALLTLFIVFSLGLQAQVFLNPHVALKPISSLSVHKVELTKEATTVTIRIVNQNQLPPFSLSAAGFVARKTSETDMFPMIKSEGAPIAPEKHIFSFRGDVLEFTMVFPPIPHPVKYLDIRQKDGGDGFFLQGIILDDDMNREITRGFRASKAGDMIQTLDAFKNVAEMDPYFEFGLAHFNVIYILARQNRWAEASEWYKKFQERFFYDKEILVRSLDQMGIIPRLEAGK